MKTLCRVGDLVVETNGSGEIFVRNEQDLNLVMRITPRQGQMIVTCHNGQLIPAESHGLPAFRVTH